MATIVILRARGHSLTSKTFERIMVKSTEWNLCDSDKKTKLVYIILLIASLTS